MASEIFKEELDLFKKTKYQGAIESQQWVEYRPKASLDGANTIEFEIQSSADEYIDMKNIYLSMTCKLIDQGGANFPAANNDHAPTNYVLNTAFEQLAIYLGSTLVSQASQHYNYMSFIEAVTTPSNFSNQSMTPSGFVSTNYWNRAKNWEEPDTNLARIFTASATVKLYGKLHGPIFNSNRLLISGVPIKLEFTKTNDRWPTVSENAAFTAAAYPKFQINEMNIYARKVKIAPAIINAHAQALRISNAIYPVKRPNIKVINLTGGQSSFNIDNLFLGQIPSKIIFGLVREDAFRGQTFRDPLRFENFNLNYLSLNVNGEMIPKVPYEPNYANERYSREYHDFLLNLGFNPINTPPIDLDSYKNGLCLYSFNLNTDFSSTDKYINLPKNGYVNLQLKFSANIPAHNVKLIVYSEFDNTIEIDENRNITTDY